jgi:hypothetical protein
MFKVIIFQNFKVFYCLLFLIQASTFQRVPTFCKKRVLRELKKYFAL